jgi:hypothetical protein
LKSAMANGKSCPRRTPSSPENELSHIRRKMGPAARYIPS